MMPAPRKRFGQHFLHDPHILQKIDAAIAPQKTDHFIEIGPGQGVLTNILLLSEAKIDAVEIDRDLAAYLRATFSNEKNLTIHEQDALTFNFAALATPEKKLRIVGNLPYNISTPLLFKLFEALPEIIDMHFMLQKEVVLRMAASTDDAVYNRLSVMTQYFCDCTYLFPVSAQAFSPPPKVESAFVRLIPRPTHLRTANVEVLSLIVKEAFTYRRKTLANSLKRLVTADQLESIGINPKARPQELTVEDFVKISKMKEGS